MYNANLIVNSPTMAGVFRCKDCHMNFHAQGLLTKHKLKFCVGSMGDSDDLQLRRGLRSTSPSRIISPDDRDDYRRNPNQDQTLRSLAENHGRQMEYLQLQNRDLEKQREDIRKRLEGLGRKSVAPATDNTSDLLRELREQEIRNQRNLDDLKRQLMGLNNQKVSVIEVEKPVYHQPPPPPPPAPEPKQNLVFPVYYGKSLVAEISAIRQAYLQNGGNDPVTLAQMAQMLAEAQAIEDQNQKPQKRSPREKPKDNMAALTILEMENERLIQELRLLQEQKSMAANRRDNDKEGKKRSHGHSHDHRLNQSHASHNSYQKPERHPRNDRYKPDKREDADRYARSPVKSYNRHDHDARSYHSEPAKRPRETVIKYTALHQEDGTVSIQRSTSFSHAAQRVPAHVPPLDLRDLSSPMDQKFSKFYDSKENSDPRKPPKYPSKALYKPKYQAQPLNRLVTGGKLSHVSEGHESRNLSQTLGTVVQLPVLPGQEQKPLPPSKPASRQNSMPEYQQPQVPAYQAEEPVVSRKNSFARNLSQDSLNEQLPAYGQTVPQFDDNDDDNDNYPPRSPMEDGTKDVAWQVRRRYSGDQGRFSPEERQSSLESISLRREY